MPTLAFWNTDGNVSPQRITAFAREADVDILILAENESPVADIIKELNSSAEKLFFPDVGESKRLTILTRFQTDSNCLIRDSPGISIRHYQMPLSDDFLVVAVHLSSKLRKKTEDQILVSTRVSRYIREAEQRMGHSRTVLIGDLNMNPFEFGVVGSERLHAITDRRIASNGSRKVQDEDCTFFYNPMWSQFGDLDSSPPGTYFYNSGGEVNYYWNVFDQVLIRPPLLPYFDNKSVSVVTELAGESLLNKHGRPDRKLHSDHLPIVCRLSEIQEAADVNS